MHSVPVIANGHETFHDGYLGPEERSTWGWRGQSEDGGGGGSWVKFHPGGPVIANVTKLSLITCLSARKRLRGGWCDYPEERREGLGGSFTQFG